MISTDEYVMMFPHLQGRTGTLPPVLMEHLARWVSVRTMHLAHLDPGSLRYKPKSEVPDTTQAWLDRGDWFAEAGIMASLLRRMWPLRPDPSRVADDQTILLGLDRILHDLQRGLQPRWSESAEMILAFGAGIHPGYLWPEALVSPARGTVAGWLGHVDRGRCALMPSIVAEYLMDIRRGAFGPMDLQMLHLAGGDRNVGALFRAATQRLEGRDVVFRLVPNRISPWRMGSIQGKAEMVGMDA